MITRTRSGRHALWLIIGANIAAFIRMADSCGSIKFSARQLAEFVWTANAGPLVSGISPTMELAGKDPILGLPLTDLRSI